MALEHGGFAQCVSGNAPLVHVNMHCRAVDDMVILAHIRDQHRLSLQSYGRPRMTEELQELGLEVGHRRVGRLMRDNDIKIIRTRKFKATTDSNHAFNIAPNLLDQDFSAPSHRLQANDCRAMDAPNQKWAGDISYIWTSEGWLYLAVILDLYSRRVIGWAPLIDTTYRLPGSGQQPHEAGSGNPGVGHGSGLTTTTQRLHPPYGSWLAVLFT